MTKADFIRLQQTEGGGGVSNNGYVATKIAATLYDGRVIETYLLVGSGSAVQPGRYFLASNRYTILDLCNLQITLFTRFQNLSTQDDKSI